MAKFETRIFNGIAPKLDARLLADGLGQVVRNAYLGAGAFEPLNDIDASGLMALPQVSGTPVKTLYLYDGGYWFTFNDEIHVVRGPLKDDPTIRTYYTGATYPRVTRNDIAIGGAKYPNASYRLGVPAPANAPTVSISGTSGGGDAVEVSYVYTYVTAWGEEGPPSAPSTLISFFQGQTATVTFDSPPSGNYVWGMIRIYRLNVGDTDADFQYLTEVAYGQTTAADNIPAAELGEVIPSYTWYPPPDDTYSSGPLLGLIGIPNGSLAGFTGQELCFTPPYLPHAWPFEYRYPVGEDIVAIALAEQGVLVLTKGFPQLAMGNDPASMAPVALNESQGCLSSRSVVRVGQYVMYASPDGIAAFDRGNIVVLTRDLISRKQWREYQPETIRAWAYEGMYVGFYGDSDTGGGFIFDPNGGKNAFIDLDLVADAGYYNADDDTLYLNVNDQLVRFDASATPLSATYRSKVFEAPFATSIGALRVDAESYPVNIRVWADGVLIRDVDVQNSLPVRLASGFRARRWEYELTTDVRVYGIELATSPVELRQ